MISNIKVAIYEPTLAKRLLKINNKEEMVSKFYYICLEMDTDDKHMADSLIFQNYQGDTQTLWEKVHNNPVQFFLDTYLLFDGLRDKTFQKFLMKNKEEIMQRYKETK